MNNMTPTLCEALVALWKTPFGELHQTINKKLALAIVRLAALVTEECSHRWRIAGKEEKDFCKSARLFDAADHAGKASASFREVDAQIMEMDHISPWLEKTKKGQQ